MAAKGGHIGKSRKISHSNRWRHLFSIHQNFQVILLQCSKRFTLEHEKVAINSSFHIWVLLFQYSSGSYSTIVLFYYYVQFYAQYENPTLNLKLHDADSILFIPQLTPLGKGLLRYISVWESSDFANKYKIHCWTKDMYLSVFMMHSWPECKALYALRKVPYLFIY